MPHDNCIYSVIIDADTYQMLKQVAIHADPPSTPDAVAHIAIEQFAARIVAELEGGVEDVPVRGE